MMPLENQVCTLEQAKIFKDEFGLELDSYFAWYCPINEENKKWRIEPLKDVKYYYSQSLISKHIYPAPNCSELGVMLPDVVQIKHPQYTTKYIKSVEYDYNVWSVFYTYYSDYGNDFERKYFFSNLHAAHAKADLLIDGLRKGYIKPEDIKL